MGHDRGMFESFVDDLKLVEACVDLVPNGRLEDYERVVEKLSMGGELTGAILSIIREFFSLQSAIEGFPGQEDVISVDGASVGYAVNVLTNSFAFGVRL